MTRRIAASAGRGALTLDELISQSNALRDEAVAAGEDLRKLRAAYRAYNGARSWLGKNRNSHDGSEVSRNEQLKESNKEGWRKWEKLRKLDGNVRAKSKEEAPARVFVMLIEMFSEFEKEDMTYEEFDEAMSDDHLGEVLLQTLEDRACYYDTSMKEGTGRDAFQLANLLAFHLAQERLLQCEIRCRIENVTGSEVALCI